MNHYNEKYQNEDKMCIVSKNKGRKITALLTEVDGY